MNHVLVASKSIEVRFSEVDSMGIVWHGNYAAYLEDGREHFGKKFGFTYLYIKETGYMLPIVEMTIQYKRSLLYKDTAIVETTYVETSAAKVIFEYKIYQNNRQDIICTGRTVQVFVDQHHRLQLKAPDFFQAWKDQWLTSPISY